MRIGGASSHNAWHRLSDRLSDRSSEKEPSQAVASVTVVEQKLIT